MPRPSNARLTRSIMRTMRKAPTCDITHIVDLAIADGVFKLVRDATPAVKVALKRLDAQGKVRVDSWKRIVRTSS